MLLVGLLLKATGLMALDQVAFSDKIGDDICAALLYVFMHHLCLICSSHWVSRCCPACMKLKYGKSSIMFGVCLLMLFDFCQGSCVLTANKKLRVLKIFIQNIPF